MSNTAGRQNQPAFVGINPDWDPCRDCIEPLAATLDKMALELAYPPRRETEEQTGLRVRHALSPDRIEHAKARADWRRFLLRMEVIGLAPLVQSADAALGELVDELAGVNRRATSTEWAEWGVEAGYRLDDIERAKVSLAQLAFDLRQLSEELRLNNRGRPRVGHALGAAVPGTGAQQPSINGPTEPAPKPTADGQANGAAANAEKASATAKANGQAGKVDTPSGHKKNYRARGINARFLSFMRDQKKKGRTNESEIAQEFADKNGGSAIAYRKVAQRDRRSQGS